jgi:Transglutaminase-like superfamily
MVQLDLAATILSAHGIRRATGPSIISNTLGALDAIAEGCAFRAAYGEFEPVHHQVFNNLGFTGDTENYHDPRNSFLPHVLRTRRGIPISLSVVFIEVAKRCGVEVLGIGMPGHFLSAHTTMSGRTRWVDAFNGGAVLELDGVVDLYRTQFGPDRPFDPASHLPAVDEHAICSRMLANLKSTAAFRRDIAALADIVWMRQYLPGPTLVERREHVRLCCAVGRFATAEVALDSLATVLGPDDAIIAEERARHAAILN